MNTAYGRFHLLAQTNMYKRTFLMTQLPNRYLTFFVVILFLIVTGGNVMAGGLIDTSVERFLAADFTNSENITNSWWTLTAGHNFLYFAQDGEDCLWNLTEVLGTTADLGGDFFVPYAGTNARVVFDCGWWVKVVYSGQTRNIFLILEQPPDRPGGRLPSLPPLKLGSWAAG